GRHLGQCGLRDAVVLHVLVDLHAEELGRRELALLAVPRRTRIERGVGDEGVGVVDLVAPAEGELDVAPLHARVGERTANGDSAHLDAGDAGEAPEGMEAHPDDGDVAAHLASAGWKANVTTSFPSSSVRRGISVSSISIPVLSAGGSTSVSRASTFTSPSST